MLEELLPVLSLEKLPTYKPQKKYLDFGFHVLDGIGGLDLQGDGFPGERFDEDLHSSSQPEDQVKGGLFLDIVV